MAFSGARYLSRTANFASRIVIQCRNTTPVPTRAKGFLCLQRRSEMSRPITRSVWYLCTRYSSGQSTGNHGDNVTSSWANVTRRGDSGKLCSCGCSGMHTNGDVQLAKYLKSEISTEMSSKQFPDIPTMADFELTQRGTIATLTKRCDNEIVKVTFNLNHSIEEEPQGETTEEIDESAPSKLRSYPEFNVEITKASQSSLSIDCRFHVHDPLEDGDVAQDEEDDDLFLIDEVNINDGKIEESTFTIGSEVMDANMYNFLMTMMVERGITDEFVEKLSDLSSALEHRLYIDFLNKFHGIVEAGK